MQNQESVWDPSAFINKHIVISNVTLRSSTRKQNVCPDIQTNCVYVNKPYGFWEGNEYFKNFQLLAEKPNVIKPKSFNTLLVFGDSLGVRFFGSLSLKPICTALFQKCKNIYSWTYVRYKYFTEEQEMHIKDNKDFNDTLFFRGIHDSIMLDKDTQSNKSVAVFNFGLHLLKSLSLKKTMELFDGFLKVLQDIRKTLGENTPHMIWKTTTAPVAPMAEKNFRFMSLKVNLPPRRHFKHAFQNSTVKA